MADTTEAAGTAVAGDAEQGLVGAALPAVGWRIAAGALWLLLVLLAYYAVHKPISGGDLAALGAPAAGADWRPSRIVPRLTGEAADLLAVLWVVVLAGTLGHALWKALRLPEPERAEARVVGTVLGLGALGLTAFALGLLGWLTTPVIWALLVLPSVALARGMLAQARWWAMAARAWWRAGWAGGWVERVALLFTTVTLGLAVMGALLPPTNAWDALSYHLVSVRADALAGRIVLDPGNPQVYQPQLTEMLYTVLYVLRGGDSAAAPLHAACGVLAVALVGLVAWRAAGPRAGVRAGALALGIPMVALIASWPYVDLLLAAAELGALTALMRWHAALAAGDSGAARGWLIAAALAAGVGLDVKYTGAYAVLALAALVACVGWRRGQSRTGLRGARARMLGALRPAVEFGMVALIVGGVWLVRNVVAAGDPVFPYHIGGLFSGGPQWDAGRTAFMQGHGWAWSALWRAPLLPLETTLLGTQGSSEFDATLGPLLLALLPLGLLTCGASAGAWARREAAPGGDARASARARVGQLLLWPLGFAALLWLVWAEELARSDVAMQSRLFLALFLALAAPAAVAWLRLEAVQMPAVSLGRLANVAVALCLGLTLLAQAAQTLSRDNLAELAGAQRRDAYLAQQLGPYASAMRALDALGPRAHVMLLWEPRSYTTNASVQPDEFLDAFNVLYRHCGDAAGIERCLRAQGFTHVLLYRQGLRMLRAQPGGKDSPAELATLDSLIATWRVIYQDDVRLIGPGPTGTGWYAVYAMRSAP